MELELRHLRVICTIAEAGSVTKAAAELGVAQPALTAQLGRIERALGGPLFERDHRGARTTPLGDLVIERSRLLLPAMAGLLDDARELTRSTRVVPEHLSLGSSTSALLAPVIQQIAERHPGLTVTTMATWSAEELAAALDDRRLDVAIAGTCAGSSPPGPPGLEWRTFSIDPVFVLVRPDHPLADREEVELSELGDEHWAATPGDGCFADCFVTACSRAGFTPASFYEADAASCVDLVTSGTAIALCQAVRALPGLVTIPLAGAPLRWNHLIGWRPGSAVESLVDDLVKTVELSHLDLIARSGVYSRWLRRHPDLGVQTVVA